MHPVIRAALATEHINDMLAQAAKAQRTRQARMGRSRSGLVAMGWVRTGSARAARQAGRSRPTTGSGQMRREGPLSWPADPAAQPAACHAAACRGA